MASWEVVFPLPTLRLRCPVEPSACAAACTDCSCSSWRGGKSSGVYWSPSPPPLPQPPAAGVLWGSAPAAGTGPVRGADQKPGNLAGCGEGPGLGLPPLLPVRSAGGRPPPRRRVAPARRKERMADPS